MPVLLANAGAVETAIQAVVNRCETIRIENGYKNDVARVYRHYVEEDALGELDTPAIFVVRPAGTTGTIQWQDERAYQETLRLDVVGLVKGDGSNPEDGMLASVAEGLLSDLKKLQMSDPQFGLGPAGVIKNSKIVSDGNDAGWDSTSAVVGMGLEVLIWWDGTNP